MKIAVIAAAVAVLAGISLSPGVIGAISPKKEAKAEKSPTSLSSVLLKQRQARGAYLARAGNCIGCHTAQGGHAYAGGRKLATPFGTFVTSNITPDKETGIGSWSEEDFWKAIPRLILLR